MVTRQRTLALGLGDARRLAASVGEELREARLGLGLSQADIARVVGMSHAQVGRLERGVTRSPRVDQVCRIARALGLTTALRLYPAGSPLRDRAHLALLARFEARLAPSLRLRREVPLPVHADRRAWDAVVMGRSGRAAIEAETRIRDAQALERRVALKLRDDPRVGCVVLLVNRTAHNRRVIQEWRESLRPEFPLDGAAILRDLGAGAIPSSSGVLLL